MTDSLPSPTRPKTNRLLELDALRAISCLNLLLFHFTYVYQNKYGFAIPINYAFPFGKYGVELFFMLSGLVNAMTLLSKRQAGDFFVARCVRIFPSYWLVVCLNVWLFAYLPFFETKPSAELFAANLTAMPNLIGFENMEPVTWTLQIELLFYGFLLLSLMLGLLDRPFRTMMCAMGVCLVCCTGFDWFQEYYPESDWNQHFDLVCQLGCLRYLPLFSMGLLLNEIRCGRGNRWLLGIGIAVSAVVFHAIDLRDHNPLATALLFGLLAGSAFGKIPLLRFRPLIFISTISYSLYLFHNNLGCLVIRQFENVGCPPWLAIGLGTMFAIALGSMITFWFEQPVTRYLNRHWTKLKQHWHAAPASKTLLSPSPNPHGLP